MRKFVVIGFVCVSACVGCDQSEEIRHYQAAKPAELAVESPEQGAKSPEQGVEPAEQGAKPATADVPRPKAPQSAVNVGDQRMLAAIVLQADQAWFFKAVGAKLQLEPQVAAFRGLLKSVRFAEGKPQWDLPEGWRQKGGAGMRFATLEFGPAEETVELTVIPLPIPPGDRAAYILSNVNRWRQQMNLNPLAAAELDQQSEQLELAGATAVVVDFHGN
jgi:hypothetical protein